MDNLQIMIEQLEKIQDALRYTLMSSYSHYGLQTWKYYKRKKVIGALNALDHFVKDPHTFAPN